MGLSENQDDRAGRWLTGIFFDFFSETAEENSTKLDRKQDLNVLFQVCACFQADRKSKMTALTYDWQIYVWLLLWNRSKEFNETIQGARSQGPLPSLWFVGPIINPRWPPCPLLGRYIVDFSSETAERYSTKFHRKQDFNVLYQVCVLRADRKKNEDDHPALWLAETFFDFFSETDEQNFLKSRTQNVAYLTIISNKDDLTLQKDLDKLELWENKWKMNFHPDKCNFLWVKV